MTMHAYQETYLNSAMKNIGDMFDFAINDFGIPADDFSVMFTTSVVCRKIENGELKYLVGKSGIELAVEVIEEKTGLAPEPDADEMPDRTPDYWCGWALCYYQWLRAIPYRRLLAVLPYEDLRGLYPTLHEADLSKFAETMDKAIGRTGKETNLKRIRNAYGYSQSGLADKSGVSLRSIQMYEQRNKDINKGQSETLLRLARALGCSMEDLLEPA